MIKVNNHENKPIAIVCVTRSGSTALSDELGKQYNLTNFEEAFHPCFPQSLNELENEPRFLFNIKCTQLNDDNKERFMHLYNKSYRIRLQRKDSVLRTASNYMLKTTGIPHYRQPPPNLTYRIVIDHKLLDRIIHQVKIEDLKLSNWPYPIDEELYYEDLIFEHTSLHVYPKPENYQDLIDLISQKLKD